MDTNGKTVVQKIIRTILRPLAEIALKCGITYREFADLSKSTFVESATEAFGIRGRPTNVSRVSILTGISRKEIKRQRDLLNSEDIRPKDKSTDATRVLSAWHQDIAYLNKESAPRELPEHGDSSSFQALCAQYGGDVPYTTMLKELLKTQAIERTEENKLRPLLRYYQPAAHDEELLLVAGSRIRDHLETVSNNVFPTTGGAPRFGGFAINDRVPADAVPEFKKFLDIRGQAFLEEVDDWLTAHSVNQSSVSTEFVRVGVDLYAIEDRSTLEN